MQNLSKTNYNIMPYFLLYTSLNFFVQFFQTNQFNNYNPLFHNVIILRKIHFREVLNP